MIAREPPHVIHLGLSATSGGAARAMARISQAMKSVGCSSSIIAADETLRPSHFRLVGKLESIPYKVGSSPAKSFSLKSGAFVATPLLRKVREAQPDFVFLHWCARSTLSIRQQGAILREFPCAVYLHDEWVFNGDRHYSTPESFEARSSSAAQLLHHLVSWRKIRHFPEKGLAITPSHWLESLARSSKLLRQWDIETIAYPLNQEEFFPEKRPQANKRGLEVLFIGTGKTESHRKGSQFLVDTLNLLNDELGNVELIVLGESHGADFRRARFKYSINASVSDNLQLGSIYRRADALLFPSLADNLPLTVMEAMSARLPVVGFDVGGVGELVRDDSMGVLVEPNEGAPGLAAALKKVLTSARGAETVGSRSRPPFIEWSPEYVGNELKTYIEQRLSNRRIPEIAENSGGPRDSEGAQ